MRRLAIIAFVLLAGCRSLGVLEVGPMPDFSARERVLGGLSQWQLDGRIGIRTPQEASSGSLRWQQRDGVSLAEIDGPLGIGGLRIEGNSAQVELSGSRVERQMLDNPEQDIAARTGVRVPVGGLRYWLLGVPIPGEVAQTTFANDGQLSVLVQAGWHIEYREYQDIDGARMPRRIVAEHADTKLTIIVRDWRTAPLSGGFSQEV